MSILSSATSVMAQGKITFSGSPGGVAKEKFKTSEYIYAKMQVPSTLDEFFEADKGDQGNQYPKNYLLLEMKVTDQQENELGAVYKKYLKPTEQELKSKSLNFDINPDPEKASTVVGEVAPFTAGVAVPFYQLFDQSAYYGRAPIYEEGKTYKVSVTVSRWKLDPTASYWMGTFTTCTGEFSMEYHAADLSVINRNGAQAKNKVLQNSKNKEIDKRGLPKEWNAKSVRCQSGETDEELKKIFLSQEPKNTEVIKCVVLPAEGAWNIYRNDKTVAREILFRWYDQTIVFFFKRDGKYYVARGGVRQDYTGDGTYGKSYLKWEEKTEIAARFFEPSKAGKK